MAPKNRESNKCFIRDFLGFSRGYTTVKDICTHLGKDPSTTSLEDLFIDQGLVYETHPEQNRGRYPTQEYFLVDIRDYTSIPFRSGCEILTQAILTYDRSSTLRKYVDEKYLVLYLGRLHVVCDNLEFDAPFNISADNPYTMCRIRQKMVYEGYRVDYTTSISEICDILGIVRHEKSVKRRVCERLGLGYSSIVDRVFLPSRRCYFRNLASGERQDFDSITKMSRHFDLDTHQVKNYIENEVEFHFRHELHRVYYL